MGIMLSTIFSPVIRRPSREITAEIAHPDGMRTCPSLFMMFTFLKTAFFPLRKKTFIFQQRVTPLAKKRTSLLIKYTNDLLSYYKCSVLSILLNYPQLKSQTSSSGEAARSWRQLSKHFPCDNAHPRLFITLYIQVQTCYHVQNGRMSK